MQPNRPQPEDLYSDITKIESHNMGHFHSSTKTAAERQAAEEAEELRKEEEEIWNSPTVRKINENFARRFGPSCDVKEGKGYQVWIRKSASAADDNTTQREEHGKNLESNCGAESSETKGEETSNSGVTDVKSVGLGESEEAESRKDASVQKAKSDIMK